MFKHLFNAWRYSWSGLRYACQDTSFRLIAAQTVVLVVYLAPLPLAMPHKAVLLLSVALCVIVELFNTALEAVVDLVSPDWHILAKKAKDLASAAQFVALIFLYAQLLCLWLA